MGNANHSQNITHIWSSIVVVLWPNVISNDATPTVLSGKPNKHWPVLTMLSPVIAHCPVTRQSYSGNTHQRQHRQQMLRSSDRLDGIQYLIRTYHVPTLALFLFVLLFPWHLDSFPQCKQNSSYKLIPGAATWRLQNKPPSCDHHKMAASL